MNLRETVNKYLKRLKSGIDCFDAFYCDTSCYVEYMARKYLNDRSFTDDVINETYVKIWHNIDKFDENRNGYGLLCKIAKNTALRINEIEIHNREELAAVAQNEEVRCDYTKRDSEEVIDLYAAIQSLSEQDRTIVEEWYIYDKTLQKIADMVGLSKPAVHKRLEKCRKKIKKFLEND